MEALMRRTPVPSELSPEDQRVYYRWTRRLFAIYMTAIILAISVTYLTRPASDPEATQMARLKTTTGSSIDPRATSIARD
jgi:hypothetical protein